MNETSEIKVIRTRYDLMGLLWRVNLLMGVIILYFVGANSIRMPHPFVLGALGVFLVIAGMAVIAIRGPVRVKTVADVRLSSDVVTDEASHHE